MIARARRQGLIDIRLTDIREFAEGKHRKVDDRPIGGGPGMVMMAEPVVRAVRSVAQPGAVVIYLSPQGRKFDAALARQLAQHAQLVLLCGHYEGVDERAIESCVDMELSIGDFILTSGCAAAVVVVEAVVRFIPGVLGHPEAAAQDSFEEGGVFDYRQYTQPRLFEGREVPDILYSGDHKKIAEWRRRTALDKTARIRPDLLHEG